MLLTLVAAWSILSLIFSMLAMACGAPWSPIELRDWARLTDESIILSTSLRAAFILADVD